LVDILWLGLGDNNGMVNLIKLAACAALGARNLAQRLKRSNTKQGFETFCNCFQTQKYFSDHHF